MRNQLSTAGREVLRNFSVDRPAGTPTSHHTNDVLVTEETYRRVCEQLFIRTNHFLRQLIFVWCISSFFSLPFAWVTMCHFRALRNHYRDLNICLTQETTFCLLAFPFATTDFAFIPRLDVSKHNRCFFWCHSLQQTQRTYTLNLVFSSASLGGWRESIGMDGWLAEADVSEPITQSDTPLTLPHAAAECWMLKTWKREVLKDLSHAKGQSSSFTTEVPAWLHSRYHLKIMLSFLVYALQWKDQVTSHRHLLTH